MLIYLQMIETDEEKSKFIQIYQAYRGLMYHTAFKLLGQEQDAEDAVHRAFVKVAENILKNFPIRCPKSPPFIVIEYNEKGGML